MVMSLLIGERREATDVFVRPQLNRSGASGVSNAGGCAVGPPTATVQMADRGRQASLLFVVRADFRRFGYPLCQA
jgi:hypothetical protein